MKHENLVSLVFPICINDFTQASNFFSRRLFADDTSLTASDKNIDECSSIEISHKRLLMDFGMFSIMRGGWFDFLLT